MNGDNEFKIGENGNKSSLSKPLGGQLVGNNPRSYSPSPAQFTNMETVSYGGNQAMYVGHGMGTTSYGLDGYMGPVVLHDARNSMNQYQPYGADIGDVRALPGTYSTGMVEVPGNVSMSELFRTNKIEKDLVPNPNHEPMYPPLYTTSTGMMNTASAAMINTASAGVINSAGSAGLMSTASTIMMMPSAFDMYTGGTPSIDLHRRRLQHADPSLVPSLLHVPSVVPPKAMQSAGSCAPFITVPSRTTDIYPCPIILKLNTDNPEYLCKKRKSRKNKKKADDDTEVSEIEKELHEFIEGPDSSSILKKLHKVAIKAVEEPMKSEFRVRAVEAAAPSSDAEPTRKTLPCDNMILDIVNDRGHIGYGLVGMVNVPEAMNILQEDALVFLMDKDGNKQSRASEIQKIIPSLSPSTYDNLNTIYSNATGFEPTHPESGLDAEKLDTLFNYAGFNLMNTGIDTAEHGKLAIFEVMSWANHSCEPNARVIFSVDEMTRKLGCTLIATRFIAKGEQIVIDYLSSTLNRNAFAKKEERNRLLKYHNLLGVDCHCVLCDLPFGALDRNESVRTKLYSLKSLWIQECEMRNYEEAFLFCKIIYDTCMKYLQEYIPWLGEITLNLYFMCHVCAANGVDVCTAEEANYYHDEAQSIVEIALCKEKKLFDNTMKYLHHYYPLRRILTNEQ